MNEEFSFLGEAAAEAGIELVEQPIVARVERENKAGRKISAIKWGSGDPEIIFLHGGSQNAHTWDSVALALLSIELPSMQSSLDKISSANTPIKNILAVDLPGHGHSDWRDDHKYRPPNLAEDISDTIFELAPNAKATIGMSLGGLTSIMLADMFPELVRSLTLIDITPGISREKAEPILEFISGPEVFDSFDAILKYTVEFNPTRSEASLIRGIKNNAKEIEGGKWTWRWDPTKEAVKNFEADENAEAAESSTSSQDFEWGKIWEALGRLAKNKLPLSLYKGGAKGSVLDDDDISEFLKCCPEAEVVIVPDAGHSIQGDKPVELANLIAEKLVS